MSDPPSPTASNPFLNWVRNDDMESLDAALSFPAGSAPLAARLNQRHPDIDDGETPLGLAVATKNIALVSLLLSHGADANVSSRAGVPPLLRAGLLPSDESMVLALLKAKADPNRSAPNDGKTPLIVAAEAAAVNMITLLLANGADPSRIDPSTGYTPLLAALRTATTTARATELLAAFGMTATPSRIDHSAVDNHGHTILHHCVLNRLYVAIEPLLSHGSDPNFHTKQTGRFDQLCSDANGTRHTCGGRTALHLANRSIEAKLLLLAGGNPAVRDDSGRSLVDYARATASWCAATAAGSTAATDADNLLQLLTAFGSPAQLAASASSSGGAIPPPLSIVTTRSSTTTSGTGADTPFSPGAPLFSPAGATPDTPATGPSASPASPTTPFHLTTPAHPSLRRPSFGDKDSKDTLSSSGNGNETLTATISSPAPSTTAPKKSVMFAEPEEPAASSSTSTSAGDAPATPTPPDFGPVAAHMNRHQRNITMQLEDLGPPGPDDGPHSTRKRKLHVAALGGRLEAVKALIKSGWSVNAATDNASTPLIMACTRGHLSVVEVLLENSADPCLTDEFGSGPLHYACRLASGTPDQDTIVLKLLDAKAAVNGPNAFRRTPIHDAVVAGSLPLVDLLIKQGADPNLADTNGSTAIHLACASEKKHTYEIVSRLIRGGAFVEAQDKRGHTPLQVALLARSTQAAEELVQYGADIRISAFNDRRTTPQELRNHLLGVAYSSVEQMVRIKLRHELKAIPLDLTLLDQCPRDGGKFGVLRKKYHCGCCGYVYCKSCVNTKRGSHQVCKTCAHVIDHPALYGMQRPPSAFGSARSYSSRSLLPPSTPTNNKAPPSPSTPKARPTSRSFSQSSNASSNASDDILPAPSAELVIDDDSDGDSRSSQHDQMPAEFTPRTPKVSPQTLFEDDPAFLQSLVAAVGELPTGDQLSLLSPSSSSSRILSRTADGSSTDGISSSSSGSGNGEEQQSPTVVAARQLSDEQSVAAALEAARRAADDATDSSPPSPVAVSSTAPRVFSSRATATTSSASSSSGMKQITRTGTLPRGVGAGDTLAALFKDDPSFLASLAVAVGDSSISNAASVAAAAVSSTPPK